MIGYDMIFYYNFQINHMLYMNKSMKNFQYQYFANAEKNMYFTNILWQFCRSKKV